MTPETVPAGAYDGESRALRQMIILTLLGRAYCHLCDDMRQALAPIADRFDARIVEIDVDADAVLDARYGDLVPVLLLGGASDGVELCHYVLDVAAVETALSAKIQGFSRRS